MPIWIGDKKLIPAPLVTMNKAMQLTPDGRAVASRFNITLEGALLPTKGSPQSNGWWVSEGNPPDEGYTTDADRFNSLLRKQELLRNALTEPGALFAYSAPGIESVTFYPVLQSLQFKPNPWVVKTEYTAELTAPIINMDNSEPEDFFATGIWASSFLSAVSDNIEVAERDDGTKIIDINRTTSATAFTAHITGAIVGGEAWRNARAWVIDRVTNFPIVSGDAYQFRDALATGTRYNFIQKEDVNKFDGSYTLTQRMISHINNYDEKRTVNRSYEANLIGDGGPQYIERINVNGTIQGYDVSNSGVTKLDAAKTYYASIVSGIGPAVGALGDPVTWTANEDPINGVLQYSQDFINASGSSYRHTYDVSFTLPQSGPPSVNIKGTVEGVTNDTQYIDPSGTTRFTRAASGWDLLKSTLKSLAFAESTVFGGTSYTTKFLDVPTNKSISFNKPQGTISYDYTFGYKGSDAGTNYLDEYTIDFSSNFAVGGAYAGLNTTASINGNITGLPDSISSDSADEKLTNAKAAWNTIRLQIYDRINNEYSTFGTGPLLSSGFVSKTLQINRFAGTIGYGAVLNNFIASGLIADQNLTIEDTLPADVAVVQVIPGRSLGPIIQSIGTITELRRNANLAITLYPSGNSSGWTFASLATARAIGSGAIAPAFPTGVRGVSWFLIADGDNWDYRNGFYTRNMQFLMR